MKLHEAYIDNYQIVFVGPQIIICGPTKTIW